MGSAKAFNEDRYKAVQGAGIKLPKYKNMIITVRDQDKEEVIPIARRFADIGYKIFATKGTSKALNAAGVKAITVRKLEQESPNLLDLVLGHEIDLIIDIPHQGAERSRDGFIIRRNASETGGNVLTSLDTAAATATRMVNKAREVAAIGIATIY